MDASVSQLHVERPILYKINHLFLMSIVYHVLYELFEVAVAVNLLENVH